MTFLSITWDDILIPLVLTHLSLKDFFNLRAVSKESRDLVDYYFSKLKRLDLVQYKNFTPEAFRVLNTNCHNIRYLNLSNCKWLSDEMLHGILANNEKVEQISLNGCLGLTGCGLQPLISCHGLKNLNVQRCCWMTDGCLQTISFHLNDLEEADFSSCILSENSLEMFVKKFHKLRVLSISNVISVTDRTMFAIAAHCHNIEHLNVSGCWRISDNGVRMVGEYCHNLKSLFVKDCHNVSERSLHALRCRLYIDKPRYVEYMCTSQFIARQYAHLQV